MVGFGAFAVGLLLLLGALRLYAWFKDYNLH